MRINEDDILERAFKAYARHCALNPHILDRHPNSTLSTVEKIEGKTFAILRNVNGVMHVYRAHENGIMRTVDAAERVRA